jgi:hypothetical protein
MSHGGNGEAPLLVGAQEVVEAIGQPGGFLILGLALGEVGESFFELWGRKYHMQSHLDPCQVVIEPFDH